MIFTSAVILHLYLVPANGPAYSGPWGACFEPDRFPFRGACFDSVRSTNAGKPSTALPVPSLRPSPATRAF